MISETWTGDGWEVRHGRWQDSAPESADCVITDPPYSDKVHAGALFRANLRDDWQRDNFEQGVHEFEAIEGVEFARNFVELARRWVLCFCPLEWFGLYESAVGAECYTRSGLWLKPDGMPQMSGDRPSAGGAEGIAIMHRSLEMGRVGRTIWNGGGKRAVWVHGVCRDSDRFHRTQKPLSLMIDLVEDFTEPGELVWDPHMGSGTTGVACLLTGRRFLGHEMQHHYAKDGADRLHATTMGLTLEDHQAGQQPLFGGAQ